MRLLNVTTLQLEQFPDEVQAPPYAILSHTWGTAEVSLQELQSLPKGHEKLGKIESSCRQALKDHLNYIWVDTCCIDKTSSAELSEAINSMFRWYETATICYAYLADVHLYADSPEFAKSRWFRRGWTLQELLAPSNLRFFNSSWKYIGDRAQLSTTIAETTKIDMNCLDSWLDSNDSRIGRIRSASVAKKMSWASERVTTRVEDMAYCLLGLFGVNMPMLYGEAWRAFVRLQEEILKESTDMTIFAWGYGLLPRGLSSTWKNAILAESPADFAACGQLVNSASTHITHYTMTNVGLHITLPLVADRENNVCYAILDSVVSGKCHIAIPVNTNFQDHIYWKRRTYTPILVSQQLMKKAQEETLYISRSFKNFVQYSSPTGIRVSHLEARGFRVASVHPPVAAGYMFKEGVDIHVDAEVVAVHFANDEEKNKFRIVFQRQKASGSATEFFLSGMEEQSAFESLKFGSSMPRIKIQRESVEPTPLQLRCQFEKNCTHTITVLAWNYSSVALEVMTEESERDSASIPIHKCEHHNRPVTS